MRKNMTIVAACCGIGTLLITFGSNIAGGLPMVLGALLALFGICLFVGCIFARIVEFFRRIFSDVRNNIQTLTSDSFPPPEEPRQPEPPQSREFTSASEFKEELKRLHDIEMEMLRTRTACYYSPQLPFASKLESGIRAQSSAGSLMISAFYSECSRINDKITDRNLESSLEKIKKSWTTVNNLGTTFGVSLTKQYLNHKLQEAELLHKFELFKQAEKERLREIREEEREKAKLEKELAERRAKIEKDQRHVATELAALNQRMRTESDPAELMKLRDRINELNDYTVKLENDLLEVEERAQQARAGYVYVISNIGSFGENVYKIGMTRRDKPMDRIDELGDASVPFRFDVHALIFSEDAVALETALHHQFADRRVNMVNAHKEFFRVSLDEIEACVKQNFSQTVEFTRTADAYEYRQTLAMQSKAA